MSTDAEKMGLAVDRAIQSFRLSYQVGEDGEHTIGLIDALTPGWHDSIVAGREECRLLIDHITNELHSAFAAQEDS